MSVARRDFADFYREHFSALVGAVTLYCGDADLAVEVVQEAMARTYRDWHRLGTAESPTAWVYRVALNLANSSFRRRRLGRRVAEHADVQPVGTDPDAVNRVVLRDALARLSRRQREAVVLRFVADLSVGDAARVMRCAQGTVKALTSQAVLALRRAGLADIEED